MYKNVHVRASEAQYLEPENYDNEYDYWNKPISYEPEDKEFYEPWEPGYNSYKAWIYGKQMFNSKK